VALLAVPQAFFGLALDGWVLTAVVCILTVTAWLTAIQRINFVRRSPLGGYRPSPDQS
jgi:CDP-diacylglycerol--glycerol-3-phosphate 3-phosphatidyltransferase